MEGHAFSTRFAAALVVWLGLVASPRLLADWGFAESWDIAKKIGELEQSGDWGISLFAMVGEYPACVLGVDDDCDGAIDGGFFLGEKEKAEKLLSQLPTEEIALGGVLAKMGWSGITIIDPETGQDMILLSSGEPPAGMIVTAPIVIDTNREAAHPVISRLTTNLGFLLVLSQVCPVRYEWDLDNDGVFEKMGYWGNNKPAFLGPGIPPGGGQDTLRVVDNNVPAKTTTFYVGGKPPETLRPGDIIVPNSNMGFKLNLVAIEDPGVGGPGPLSNMGFKLNYALWQGGDHDPENENWWGHCNAWAMGSWALLPIEDVLLASVRYAGTGLCSVVGAFEGNKLTDGCEVNVTAAPPMEEVSLNFSGSGRMVLFYAGRHITEYAWDMVGGSGPAAVVVMEGEGWSIQITKKIAEERLGGEAGDEDIVFLTPQYNPLSAGRGAFSTVNCGVGEEEMAWQWDPRTNTWPGLLTGAEDREGIFVRGEVNLDSLEGPDISDGIFILNWLFIGGRKPLCLDAADVNDDGVTDISDGVFLLSFLFIGGNPPKAPFPGAGIDPTSDPLDCDLLR